MSPRAEPPAPEAELALLLAGTRARRESAAGRMRDLADRADERSLVSFLMRQRLLVLLGTRLIDAAPDAVSADLVAVIDDARQRSRTRGLLFTAATEHLVDMLEARRIPAVAIKGPGLARELYGDEGLRDYEDIDVLVPGPDLARAVAVAGELGWTPNDAPDRLAKRLPLLHVFLRHASGSMPDLELHWRIHWYETRFATAMIDRRRATNGPRRLDPVDQIAALLLFYARDGLAGLRLPADIAAWWDREGSTDRLLRMQRLIDEHPGLAEAWRAALLIAVEVGALPPEACPPEAHPHTRRGMLACRLANWDLRGADDQIKANVALIDGLLTPRRGARAWLTRQLTPPSALVETLSARRRGPATVATWRVVHAVKTTARALLALRRIRARGRWTDLPAADAPQAKRSAREPAARRGRASRRAEIARTGSARHSRMAQSIPWRSGNSSSAKGRGGGTIR